MKTITDNFEVLWNTKHKDDIKIKFIVPIKRDKRWWEFWKKSPEKIIMILIIIKIMMAFFKLIQIFMMY